MLIRSIESEAERLTEAAVFGEVEPFGRNTTLDAPLKFDPVTVTRVPPAVVPELGFSPETWIGGAVGGGGFDPPVDVEVDVPVVVVTMGIPSGGRQPSMAPQAAARSVNLMV